MGAWGNARQTSLRCFLFVFVDGKLLILLRPGGAQQFSRNANNWAETNVTSMVELKFYISDISKLPLLRRNIDKNVDCKSPGN